MCAFVCVCVIVCVCVCVIVCVCECVCGRCMWMCVDMYVTAEFTESNCMRKDYYSHVNQVYNISLHYKRCMYCTYQQKHKV